MENATKALLMAGSVLISIMLATFFIMMLRSGGRFGSEYDEQAAQNELVKFNSQFEVYAKNDNSFYDVLTVANMAYNINKNNNFDSTNGVVVVLNAESNYYMLNNLEQSKDFFSTSNASPNNSQSLYDNTFISQNTETQKELATGKEKPKYVFVGELEYSNTTGKVEKVTFTRNEN